MAKITRENVNQIITRMTYHSPEKLNDFNTEHTLTKRLKALVALADAKENFNLDDLIGAWYGFYDDVDDEWTGVDNDVDNEWTNTCYLIKSFRSLNGRDPIWNCRDINFRKIMSAIITESENPFTKKELENIMSYFDVTIRILKEQEVSSLYSLLQKQDNQSESKVELYTRILREEDKSKSRLYTKIKELWLQFYLNQEA